MATRYLDNRLIAMLDVVGFSGHLKNRESILDMLETYTQMIAHAKERILVARSSDEANRELDAQAFQAAEFVFDTIILVSLPLSAVQVGAFIGATCTLMSYFAQNNLPLRGAIGIGDYASAEQGATTRISVSNISKELSNAEGEQQWSGCVLLPEYEAQIIEYLEYNPSHSIDQSSALYRYCVPLKRNVFVDAYCLNWMMGLPREHDEQLIAYMAGDQEKQQNTKAFIQFFRSLPRTEYLLPENFFPARFATVLRSGPGVQIALWDKDGRTPESIGCKHIVFDPRRPSNDAFRGYDTEEEEARLDQGW